MLASFAETISAVGAALGAVLAGVAALIAAWARREATKTRKQTDTGNGTTLAETVQRVQSELAEQRPLMEWARLRRASELTGVRRPSSTQVRDAETLLNTPLEDLDPTEEA